jgi:hypothetical protein
MRMTALERFDFVETCRALSEAETSEDLAQVIAGNPRAQRLADRIAADVSTAPPLTPQQRAGIRAVFQGSGRA